MRILQEIASICHKTCNFFLQKSLAFVIGFAETVSERSEESIRST